MKADVLFAGVGGQGIVTASDILAHAALCAGLHAKKAETHGMAQRGGSVISHVRISSQPVASPLIPEGQADFLVALELLEGLRWLWMLAPTGRLLADRRRIDPLPVQLGQAAYPEDAEERLAERGITIDATYVARRIGQPRAANAVMLGALAAFVELPDEAWRRGFESCLKPRYVDVNWQAFREGRRLATPAEV